MAGNFIGHVSEDFGKEILVITNDPQTIIYKHRLLGWRFLTENLKIRDYFCLVLAQSRYVSQQLTPFLPIPRDSQRRVNDEVRNELAATYRKIGLIICILN